MLLSEIISNVREAVGHKNGIGQMFLLLRESSSIVVGLNLKKNIFLREKCRCFMNMNMDLCPNFPV